MINKPKGNSNKLFHFSPGILVLENKTVFRGIGIGCQGTATGEVCFNTSLTGYQEIISDPSYAGQIINFTFPHIGNVGTNEEDHESDNIWARGVIFNSEITNPSNYRSLKNLDTWLKKNKIVGITGLDTRNLTNFIRDKGAPKGTISNNKNGKFNLKKLLNLSIKWPGLNKLDLAKTVTTKKKYVWQGYKTWKKGKGFEKNNKKIFKIIAIDYGIKKNILRYFSDFNCKVNIVSCKTDAEAILKLKPDGIFLSNGPGDPAATVTVVPCTLSASEISNMRPDGIFLSNGPGDPAATGKYAIEIIQNLIKENIPIFGICLGHQILALALNAKTKKMKLGHRGANHPVKNLLNQKPNVNQNR